MRHFYAGLVTDSAPWPQRVDDVATDAPNDLATDDLATDDLATDDLVTDVVDPDAADPDAAATDSAEAAATTGSSPDDGLEVAMATIEEAEGVLGDVEAALERLEAGQYLTCEICGAPLEVAILVGAPTLRRCVVHAR
jgi:RNA polymerase-binding transcription factor DksA